MSELSGIQWCDSTLNEMSGCNGCELWDPARGVFTCWAGQRIQALTKSGTLQLPGWPAGGFDHPMAFPHRMELLKKWKDLTGKDRVALPGKPWMAKPWMNGLPRVIFMDDMGDAFTPSLSVDRLTAFLPLMASVPHLLLFLTKHPATAAEWSRSVKLPDNVAIGTSITGPQDARLRQLDSARCATRFVSYEPTFTPAAHLIKKHPGITWWIVGGSSGKYATPTDVQILEDVVTVGAEENRSVFVKQLGALPFKTSVGGRSQFHDFQHWVNKAPTWIAAGDTCVDAKGRPCRIGFDFMRARDEGTFPVTIRQRLHLRDKKGGDWTEWPENIKVRQMPWSSRSIAYTANPA